jgi:hypothetical protein
MACLNHKAMLGKSFPDFVSNVLELFSFFLFHLSQPERKWKGGNQNALDKQSIFITYLRNVNGHCRWCPRTTH